MIIPFFTSSIILFFSSLNVFIMSTFKYFSVKSKSGCSHWQFLLSAFFLVLGQIFLFLCRPCNFLWEVDILDNILWYSGHWALSPLALCFCLLVTSWFILVYSTYPCLHTVLNLWCCSSWKFSFWCAHSHSGMTVVGLSSLLSSDHI